ncbi:hypothetical protein QBC35DRAFT_234353 [Podospora australis]|uniref:Secreted protein n=1 Tax=Podospora australis TaxID=1536484 RepID=A0AAN7AG35_9PEZI|nr:hypothetical protein QBC35DRAFT_234353 [Podospora australis]
MASCHWLLASILLYHGSTSAAFARGRFSLFPSWRQCSRKAFLSYISSALPLPALKPISHNVLLPGIRDRLGDFASLLHGRYSFALHGSKYRRSQDVAALNCEWPAEYAQPV